MHFTAEQAVDKGADWLDAHYPGWVASIDLSILDISRCQQCVLGQVWSGHIPTVEKNQLVGQVMATLPNPVRRFHFSTQVDAGLGFDILYAVHEMLPDEVALLGFSASYCPDPSTCESMRCMPTYAQLLDVWTVKIIQRRLDVHPDIVAGCSDLNRIASEQYASVS